MKKLLTVLIAVSFLSLSCQLKAETPAIGKAAVQGTNSSSTLGIGIFAFLVITGVAVVIAIMTSSTPTSVHGHAVTVPHPVS